MCTPRKSGMSLGMALIIGLVLMATPASVLAALDFVPLDVITQGLSMPEDVAVAADGTIYILDGRTARVLVYSPAGEVTGLLPVDRPTAVAAGNGVVYVGSSDDNSVAIYTAAGQLDGYLGNGADEFEYPKNIAVDDFTGRVYVVDQFDDSIKMYTAAGGYLGRYPDDAEQDNMPLDITIANNRLYILDRPEEWADSDQGGGDIRGARVLVLELDGSKAFEFASYGADPTKGEFLRPKGITSDSQGYIYATDGLHGVVIRFNPDGTSPEVYQDPESAMVSAQGVAMSVDGRLLVASAFTGEVKIYGVDRVAGEKGWLNPAPVADAGPDQIVDEETPVTLDGSGSFDENGSIDTYAWTQTGGPLAIDLQGADTENPSFTAPAIGPGGAVLTFELVVTDDSDKSSIADTCQVEVNNVLTGSVEINGGALYTNSLNVSLDLSAPGAAVMRLGNEEDGLGAWQPYAEDVAWTLAAGADGPRTVYVEFKDTPGSGSGVTDSASGSITVDTTPPDVPGAVDITVPGGVYSFAWEDTTENVYRFHYADNPAFNNATTVEVGINAYELADTLAEGTWYWRVQAVDEAGNESPWSSVGIFTVGPGVDCVAAMAEPGILAPAIGTDGVETPVMLKAGPYADGDVCGGHWLTEWEISGAADFSGPAILYTMSVLDNLTSFQVPDLVLEPDTEYFWRVRYHSNTGVGFPWSAVGSFRTAPAAGDANGDGVPDSLTVSPAADVDEDGVADQVQADIIWFMTAAGDRQVGIGTGGGLNIQSVSAMDPADTGTLLNPSLSWPLGLAGARIAVPEAGAQVAVTVFMDEPLVTGARWYQYSTSTGWQDYSGYAAYSGDRLTVTLLLTDGGVGDADGVANGIIVHQSGPMVSPGRSFRVNRNGRANRRGRR